MCCLEKRGKDDDSRSGWPRPAIPSLRGRNAPKQSTQPADAGSRVRDDDRAGNPGSWIIRRGGVSIPPLAGRQMSLPLLNLKLLACSTNAHIVSGDF